MSRDPDTEPGKRPRTALRGGVAAFVVAIAGAVVFLAAYWSGGQVQLEGLGLALAFGGIGYGLVSWAHRLMPNDEVSEPRGVLPSGATERESVRSIATSGAEEIDRRKVLRRLLTVAGLTLGAALLSPLRSMGLGARPSVDPATALVRTPWGADPPVVVVDAEGEPIRVDTLAVGEVVTVYPAGHVEEADAQAQLIRLPDEAELTAPTRADWVVQGNICYSKVCTHAGCPVGLYEAESLELFCPCHQSAFAVVEGARPTQGPATRALPQLPLDADEDGRLIATGDFPHAVGPGWWTRPRAEDTPPARREPRP